MTDTLPPDPEGMNEKRADWARAALDAFTTETRQDDDQEALVDLVADLLHLADRLGMDPEQVLRRAWVCYEEETTDKETFDPQEEGWALFNDDEIQRIDEPGLSQFPDTRFASDDEAIGFVLGEALDGSDDHRLALEKHCNARGYHLSLIPIRA